MGVDGDRAPALQYPVGAAFITALQRRCEQGVGPDGVDAAGVVRWPPRQPPSVAVPDSPGSRRARIWRACRQRGSDPMRRALVPGFRKPSDHGG